MGTLVLPMHNTSRHLTMAKSPKHNNYGSSSMEYYSSHSMGNQAQQKQSSITYTYPRLSNIASNWFSIHICTAYVK